MKTTTAQLNTIVNHLNSIGTYQHVVTVGPKYARIAAIIRGNLASQSVVCFVDMMTGDVLKPASWSRPAKHPRGNVNAADAGLGAFDANGNVIYLR